MRTISSTVGTMDEAQAVSRRLQEMGVGPDNISLRALGGTDAERPEGVFISAKVAPDQVRSATEIMDGSARTAAILPTPAPDTGSDDAPLRGTSEKAVWPPPVAPKPIIQRGPPVREETAPASVRKTSPMRLLVVFGLIIAAGIILGYLLGSVT